MTTLVQRSPVKITPVSSPLLRQPKTYTMDDVRKHHDDTSCWIVVEEKVYDVTKFLQEHPGGSDIVLEYAGSDATAAFVDKGHSPDAFAMLDEYYIGQLVQQCRQHYKLKRVG